MTAFANDASGIRSSDLSPETRTFLQKEKTSQEWDAYMKIKEQLALKLERELKVYLILASVLLSIVGLLSLLSALGFQISSFDKAPLLLLMTCVTALSFIIRTQKYHTLEKEIFHLRLLKEKTIRHSGTSIR